MADFSGKAVMVVGGSRGIGSGIVSAFADAGAEGYAPVTRQAEEGLGRLREIVMITVGGESLKPARA